MNYILRVPPAVLGGATSALLYSVGTAAREACVEDDKTGSMQVAWSDDGVCGTTEQERYRTVGLGLTAAEVTAVVGTVVVGVGITKAW